MTWDPDSDRREPYRIRLPAWALHLDGVMRTAGLLKPKYCRSVTPIEWRPDGWKISQGLNGWGITIEPDGSVLIELDSAEDHNIDSAIEELAAMLVPFDIWSTGSERNPARHNRHTYGRLDAGNTFSVSDAWVGIGSAPSPESLLDLLESNRATRAIELLREYVAFKHPPTPLEPALKPAQGDSARAFESAVFSADSAMIASILDRFPELIDRVANDPALRRYALQGVVTAPEYTNPLEIIQALRISLTADDSSVVNTKPEPFWFAKRYVSTGTGDDQVRSSDGSDPTYLATRVTLNAAISRNALKQIAKQAPDRKTRVAASGGHS
jgi:hypothetical protein